MWLLLFVGITTVLIILIRLYIKHFDYWTDRGIPGPKPSLFIGNLPDIAKIEYPVTLRIREWTQKYGKVYGFFEGYRKVLVISDLDMLQEMFVKKFDYFYGRKLAAISGNVDDDPRVHVFESRGSRWKRLRSLANPVFTVNSLKKIRHTVEDSALHLVNHMSKHADKDAFNIHEFYQEYTMDIILRVAMGQKGSKQFENPTTQMVAKVFLRDENNPWFYTANIIPYIGSLVRDTLLFVGKTTGTLPFTIVYDQVTKAVEDRIKQRAKGIKTSDESDQLDLIDMFLDLKVEENHIDKSSEFTKTNIHVSKSLTKMEIVAQCFVFLLAGFDTTANSLAYASYLLANYPEIRKKLQDEIDTFCNDESINYETLSSMKYLDCVIKEALRMYPLASFASSRECLKSTTLGDLEIEKGTLVMADPWTIHYDKTVWGQDADEFVPERWESTERRHLLSWFPFGAGPRQCVGMRLAYMEEKLALIHILKKFDIVKGPKTEKKLSLVGCFTTSPTSVTVYLKSRSE